MRTRTVGIISILGAVLCVGGIGFALGGTETPLSERIAASEYDVADLSGAKCSPSYSGLPNCDAGDNAGNPWATSYTYRPVPNTMCTYRFYRNGFGLFWTGGWEARIEWNPEELTNRTLPLGATGFKGNLDPKKPITLIIEEPTPSEPWAFAQKHLKEPDEKCNHQVVK